MAIIEQIMDNLVVIPGMWKLSLEQQQIDSRFLLIQITSTSKCSNGFPSRYSNSKTISPDYFGIKNIMHFNVAT